MSSELLSLLLLLLLPLVLSLLLLLLLPVLLPLDVPVLGAVVVSGRSEAAGGSDVSVSAGGNGAEVLVESPPGPSSFAPAAD